MSPGETGGFPKQVGATAGRHAHGERAGPRGCERPSRESAGLIRQRQSWTKHGPILFGDPELDRRGTIQPTVVEIAPGVVRGFFRTNRMGKVATSLSRDGGRSWAPMRLTGLDHPGAGIDSLRLADGRCILIYNPSTSRRTPLSLAVSFDAGVTWEDFLVVEALEEGQRGELSYPAMIQDANGDLQMTSTWNRQRIRHATVPLGLVPTGP